MDNAGETTAILALAGSYAAVLQAPNPDAWPNVSGSLGSGAARERACLFEDISLRNDILNIPYKPLTKADILSALNRLGELAQAQGLTLELALYGGAVFTVVYGSRASTKDVDAIVRPGDVAKKLALQVAREQGLPEDWLNDNVRLYLAEKEAKKRLALEEFGPGLTVSVPTAKYLLAMKVQACRAPLPGYASDQEDILYLVRKMGLKTLGEVEDIYHKFFPRDELDDRRRLTVEAILEKARTP